MLYSVIGTFGTFGHCTVLILYITLGTIQNRENLLIEQSLTTFRSTGYLDPLVTGKMRRKQKSLKTNH